MAKFSFSRGVNKFDNRPKQFTAVGVNLDPYIQLNRDNQVSQKLQISSAKLFDLIAKRLFPKPLPLLPVGRAVGWLKRNVNSCILHCKRCAEGGAV